MEKRVTVEIPVKAPGNIIHNKAVDFEIEDEGDHFKATPLLDIDERRIANLPIELHFKIEKGKAISLRGIRDGNQHVVEAIGQVVTNMKQEI